MGCDSSSGEYSHKKYSKVFIRPILAFCRFSLDKTLKISSSSNQDDSPKDHILEIEMTFFTFLYEYGELPFRAEHRK